MNSMNVKYKKAETTSELIDALRLRIEAYSEEYGAQAGREQQDEDDKISTIYVALSADGAVVSTARYMESPKGDVKIQRVATRKEYRHKGIGSGLIKYMLGDIVKMKPKRILLWCQVPLRDFYAGCGFKQVSEPFEKGGILQVKMEYCLAKPGRKHKKERIKYIAG